jgi:hypothetical protein
MARVDERTLDNNALRILTLSHARKRHRPAYWVTSSAWPGHPPFAEREVMECGLTEPTSLRLDVRRLDHLAPFLGLVGDELTEIGGREREHVATEIGNPRLHIGVGKSSVDLLV